MISSTLYSLVFVSSTIASNTSYDYNKLSDCLKVKNELQAVVKRNKGNGQYVCIKNLTVKK
jgi:hypothetical protein